MEFQSNQRVVKCRGCGAELAPGMGAWWSSVAPWWKPGGGRFICAGCLEMHALWLKLYTQAARDLWRIQDYIFWLPGEGRLARGPGGLVGFRDVRSLAQEEMRRLIWGADVWFAACARWVAEALEAEQPATADEAVELARETVQVVLRRVGSVVRS